MNRSPQEFAWGFLLYIKQACNIEKTGFNAFLTPYPDHLT
jgi:hypothetical protein